MYVVSQLFLYKPIFMTELLIAQSLFFFRLKRRRGFLWRAALGLLVCYAAAVAIPIVRDDPLWCSFLFFAMYGVTTLAFWFAFDVSFISILFCSVSGYTAQHIAFQIYDCLSMVCGFHGDIYSNMATATTYQPFTEPLSALTYLLVFIFTYAGVFLFFGSRIERGNEIRLKGNVVMAFVFICMLTDIVLSSYVTYFVPPQKVEFYLIFVDVFSVLFCLMTLCFQFELLIRRRMEQEMAVVNGLLVKEQERYESVKETIHMVNRKCHDFKYLIRKMGGDAGVSKEAIAEIESAVEIYESSMQTGNEALDIILSEKKQACKKNGIELSCIADGTGLSFMSDADIYVLFGNALDNAIEAVSGMEPDKRFIGVRVMAVKDFITIKIHNYYHGELVFSDDLPMTTKQDKLSHGYGMSSMKVICEKYRGDMQLNAAHNIFELGFLFPIDNAKSA